MLSDLHTCSRSDRVLRSSLGAVQRVVSHRWRRWCRLSSHRLQLAAARLRGVTENLMERPLPQQFSHEVVRPLRHAEYGVDDVVGDEGRRVDGRREALTCDDIFNMRISLKKGVRLTKNNYNNGTQQSIVYHYST
jgi:hypothetical protein